MPHDISIRTITTRKRLRRKGNTGRTKSKPVRKTVNQSKNKEPLPKNVFIRTKTRRKKKRYCFMSILQKQKEDREPKTRRIVKDKQQQQVKQEEYNRSHERRRRLIISILQILNLFCYVFFFTFLVGLLLPDFCRILFNLFLQTSRVLFNYSLIVLEFSSNFLEFFFNLFHQTSRIFSNLIFQPSRIFF